MIVGGYTLDLYCCNAGECAFIGKEYEDSPGGNTFVSMERSRASIYGESKAACVMAAKARGWVFSGGDAICKWCVKREAK